MRDVKLWFAYNENKEVIKINDADINKTYFCPCCGADVFPKATKSKKVTMHFCHVSGESCTSNGGESYIHKWIKTVLFTPNQIIKVNTKDGIKEYTVKEVEIEKRYETSQGDYIPDISILTYEGEKIFAEIYNTNKKSIKKYWLKWFELGNTVVEIAVDDIINKDLGSMVLEPIYEDSDRFRNFEESDYKGLIGKKVNDKEREQIKKLYNDVYDYINNNDTIAKLYNHSKVVIKKYVCSSILNDILTDIKNFEELLYECTTKGIGCGGWYGSYSSHWKSIKIAKLDRLSAEFEKFKNKGRDNKFYLNRNNSEINEYLNMYDELIKMEIRDRLVRPKRKGWLFKQHSLYSFDIDSCKQARAEWEQFIERLHSYKRDEYRKVRFVKNKYKDSRNRQIEFYLKENNQEVNEILKLCNKVKGDVAEWEKIDFIRSFYSTLVPCFIDGYEDECKKILSEGIEDYIYKLENFTYKSNRD